MPTAPSNKATDVIQDAKQLVKTAKKRIPALVKADKAKGKTAGTNMSTVKALEDAIVAYGDADSIQLVHTTDGADATVSEAEARTALADALTSIRDDVADANDANLKLQAAFGRGTNLTGKTTNPLLKAADAFAASFKTHAAKVKSSGVDKKRMNKLAALRTTLENADDTQRVTFAERGDSTGDKVTLLKTVKKLAAKIRTRLAKAAKSAAGAKKGSGKRKGTLASTSPRKTVKKRAAKPAAVTTTSKKSG